MGDEKKGRKVMVVQWIGKEIVVHKRDAPAIKTKE